MAQVTESILFRQKLYQNFKESGLLSKLKTTLRTNLLEQLQKPYSQNKQDLQDKLKPLHLKNKFIVCAINQFLVKKGYEYSRAILLPQCNLEDHDCLNYNQLSEIINLNCPQKASFLQTIFEQWFRFKALQAKQRSTQTDFDEPLSKKLQRIQKQYSGQIDYWKLTKPKKQQLPPSEYERQEKLKLQFQSEKRQAQRDFQIQISDEMRKKYEGQYDFKMKQLQKAHEGRLNEIKQRQKQILDSLERKTKELQEKAKKLREQELKMLQKYERRLNELQQQYARKLKELEDRQKEFWKKQLQLRAKKRQYQQSIRLVKQKVIQEASR